MPQFTRISGKTIMPGQIFAAFNEQPFERLIRTGRGFDPMFENQALSPSQVASRLQVSEGKVLRWLSAGQLRGLKIGGEWRTSTLFLAAFLEAHANRPAPKPAGRGPQGQLYVFTRRERA